MSGQTEFKYAKTRYETSRTFKTKSLQTLLKPIKGFLIKPKRPIPAGSPQLEPSSNVYDFCNVIRREIEGINIYDINARCASTDKGVVGDRSHGIVPAAVHARLTGTDKPSEDVLDLNPTKSHQGENIISNDFAHNYKGRPKRKHVFYFAGGGWQSVASSEHWKFCATIVAKSPTTTVTMVSYPLAPNSPAAASIPQLVKLYLALFPPMQDNAESQSNDSLMRVPTSPQHPEECDDIIFAGDSAGANVALALTLHVLATVPNVRAPAQLLLICPVVDLRHVNPKVKEIAKYDPILSLDMVEGFAKDWMSGLEATDPRVSPIFGDFSLLAKHNVSVNGIIAGHDLLSPDALELRQKCEDNGIHGVWLHWEKMMHCFPLTYSYGFSESRVAMNWILTLLNVTNQERI